MSTADLLFTLYLHTILQGFEDVSANIKSKPMTKLMCCIDYKKSQVAEICSFRSKLDSMSDTAAAELHKVSVNLRYS